MTNTAAKKITYDGKPVQVESAIRDGTGKIIANTYLTSAVTNVATGTDLTGGPITTSGTINHADSGVTAGTYQSVTVNARGHVTAGTNIFAATNVTIYEVD